MTFDQYHIADPKMQAAVTEIQELIRAHFPSAKFTVGEADDPDGVYMRAIVDVDDTDDVMAVFLDRLVDAQVKEDLPLSVVPVQTPERIAAYREQQRDERARGLLRPAVT